jgi:predicted alpha/beta superfamily hydrolase
MVALPLVAAGLLPAAQPYYDRTHDSRVFGEKRNFRIFLPTGYDDSSKHYPVVYYFHGHSDRYTLEQYDGGLDTVPKIEKFVGKHDVIVVAADGYIAKDYKGFYGGAPYDVRREGNAIDYGEYFLELVRYIDANYRTLTSRRFRATSGLSMGGFMSLFLSARYPDLIGSASAFNPGPEFYVGESNRRSLWRPKDHVLNHAHTMIRLVRASGDYISQYHEETRDAYAHTPQVDFEYRQDEYHRHWATSIAETLDFHMRAFANPALDTKPSDWNYTSAYRQFSVHGYSVSAKSSTPAFIRLEHVNQNGLRVTSRQWEPDGPSGGCESVSVTTAPVYKAGASYAISDLNLATGKVSTTQQSADAEGKLRLEEDCNGHQIGFEGPGAQENGPVLLPRSVNHLLTALPGKPFSVPVRIYNPGSQPLGGMTVEVRSDYPTVEVIRSKTTRRDIGAHEISDYSPELQVRFTAGDGGFARTRLYVTVSSAAGSRLSAPIDVYVAPDHLEAPAEVLVLDGRAHKFSVFRQRGNQGGGASVEREVREGTGNGNGILEPGEQATVWLRLRQGVDPFDKGNWCRAKIYSDSPWLTEVADIQEDKGLEWTGAQNRTSVVKLSRDTPRDVGVPAILDCESWSYRFTPDVRYGREPLYQAFQIHKHHLFVWNWKADLSKSVTGENQ